MHHPERKMLLYLVLVSAPGSIERLSLSPVVGALPVSSATQPGGAGENSTHSTENNYQKPLGHVTAVAWVTACDAGLVPGTRNFHMTWAQPKKTLIFY